MFITTEPNSFTVFITVVLSLLKASYKMFQKVLTVGTLFSALLVLLSIYLNDSPDDELTTRLRNVLQGLIEVENQFESETPKVAVGYGACNDLFVNGLEFLEYDGSITPEHYDDINSVEELKKMFVYFFRHGAAAE